ncbi:MAG: glutamyl-tRNA reductase [Clostridium sp.]
MIVLLGIKKNTSIQIREEFSLKNKEYNKIIGELLFEFDECAILNTCNRVEIYLKCNSNLTREYILTRIFNILKWKEEYTENIFMLYDESVYKHIFELACGFHSKIIGEDQIIGQIRECYKKCSELGALKCELLHLFESSIACGKEFRTKARLYEIPVSSASIVANKCIKIGYDNLMIIGFGDVGELVFQYLKGKNPGKVFVVVRDKEKYRHLEMQGIILLDYKEKDNIINNMDIIISCTASPHIIIKPGDINELGNEVYIFDLALPRDVDNNIKLNSRVTLLNIDEISKEDDINKELRVSTMKMNRNIIKKHLEAFITWMSSREISQVFRLIKNREDMVCRERVDSYIHKTNGENVEMVKVLIKSTSDFYVNKAIEVLKEEISEGRESECLRVIEKIFLREN